MTNDPIDVEEVTIRRAPGFESKGFAVEDICSGINIVHGPNATGKTTFAKSIEGLFWPEAVDGHTELIGQLSLNGDSWRVELNGGRVNYQQNGQDTGRPNLPPVDQRDRYRLSLHDLLLKKTDNETFAETIERESAGGYDLIEARDELEYKDSPVNRGKGVVKDAEQAVQKFRDARSDIDELRQEQERLARLREELNDAKQAKNRVELLEQAISYAEAREALKDAESKLDEFPDVLERVDSDEASEVTELEEKIKEWNKKTNNAKENKKDAQKALEEADLPDDGISTGRLDRLKELRNELGSLEDQKRDLEAELNGAKRKQTNAQQDIPLDVAEEDLVELNPVSWKDVSKFARKAEEVQARDKSRKAIEELLENDEQPDVELSALKRGSQSLEDWLTTASSDESDSSAAAFKIALVSSTLLSVAGIVLGLLVHPVLYVTLLAAAGLLLYGHRTRTSKDTDRDPRKPHRESFEQTGLDSPDSWTEDVVRSHLLEIYDTIAEQKFANERDQQRETLTANKKQLEDQKQSLEETRTELRERLGAAPDTTDVELAVITKRVLDWQEAHDEVVSLEDKLDAVEDQLETGRNELQAKLEPYGYDGVESAPEAKESIRNLEHRKSEHETAKENLARTENTISEANDKVEQLQSQRDQIFTDLDLVPANHDKLQDLCDQVSDYEDAKTEVEKTKALAENEEAELKKCPGYESALKQQTVQNLEVERREAEETAEGYDDIHTQITEIETKIGEAKADNAVETAITEKERALDALEDQIDEDAAAMVGDVLVDHVQETTLEASRPAVFERARGILTTITRGHYRLDLDEDKTTFRAFDTTKQKGFALDELSSATRVQLLLAVRIAFVEQQEQGMKLPLLLDETLANTDDLRADVIIKSMIELAREGRQIFYFTAQGDEVAKWLDALEDAETIDHSVTDLADVRDLDRTVHIPDVDDAVTLTPDPPSPDGHDYTSYGDALDVEPFNPHQGVGAVHLWYVVEDVELLHRLLELGIERWGQLNNLLERGSGNIVTEDTEHLEPVRRNAAALDEFVAAWKIGRGKPVERQVLESSGAVSSTFIDEVTELAESVNGDGERIIDTLRDGQVDGFYTGKMDELETYFKEQGYIESSDSLDEDQIRIRVVERFVDAGVPRENADEKAATLLTRLQENQSV